MIRTAVRVAVAVLVAYTFGWLAGRLPAPADPTEFWIGNVGGPYLLVGFAVGAWATRRPVTAAIAGSVSAVAAICGFYDFGMIWWNARAHQGLPPGAPWLGAVRHAYGQWLALMLWGSIPWLTIAVVIGFAAGYLGYRWTRRGDQVWARLAGAALIAEPLLYLTRLNAHLPVGWTYARSRHNITIWAVEALLGAAVIVVTARPPQRVGQGSPGAENAGAVASAAKRRNG